MIIKKGPNSSFELDSFDDSHEAGPALLMLEWVLDFLSWKVGHCTQILLHLVILKAWDCYLCQIYYQVVLDYVKICYVPLRLWYILEKFLSFLLFFRLAFEHGTNHEFSRAKFLNSGFIIFESTNGINLHFLNWFLPDNCFKQGSKPQQLSFNPIPYMLEWICHLLCLLL